MGLDEQGSHIETALSKQIFLFSVSAQEELLSEGKLLSAKVVSAVPSEHGASVLHHNGILSRANTATYSTNP